MSDAFQSVGYDASAEDDFGRRLLRFQLAPYACDAGVESCLTGASKQLNNYLKEKIA